jgi:CheY-like chemotaxis protein
VDDSAALMRRLERNLHDGAQIRLATLALNLGMAREKLCDSGEVPDAAATRELVDAALRGAKDALGELRNLARGLHPPVLDNGLADALASLAADSPTPVELEVSIPVQPTPAIETIAYFCAAELLANATKHSFANKIAIRAAGQRNVLLLSVADDGTGGAEPARGTGLSGLAQRAARWTAASRSRARPAAQRRSPSSSRCAHERAGGDRRGRGPVPGGAHPADRGPRPPVCAAVGDGSALLAAVAEHQPDVVVADIRMPPTHTDEGLRAAIEIRRQYPRTGVLVLSQYIETTYTARLLEGNGCSDTAGSQLGEQTWPLPLAQALVPDHAAQARASCRQFVFQLGDALAEQLVLTGGVLVLAGEDLAVAGQFIDAVGEGSAGELFELAPEFQAHLAPQFVALCAQLPDLRACQFKVSAQASFGGLVSRALCGSRLSCLPGNGVLDVLTDALGVNEPGGHPGGADDSGETDRLACAQHLADRVTDTLPLLLAVAAAGFTQYLGRRPGGH